MAPIAFTSYGYLLTRDGKVIPPEKRDPNFVVRMRMPIAHDNNIPTSCAGDRVKGNLHQVLGKLVDEFLETARVFQLELLAARPGPIDRPAPLLAPSVSQRFATTSTSWRNCAVLSGSAPIPAAPTTSDNARSG